MALPDIGAFATRIWRKMTDASEIAPEEIDEDGSLALFIGAIGEMSQEIDTLVRGDPPWATLLDVDNIPAQYLPWLAQSVGVQLTEGMSEADQRTTIKKTGGWLRGTPASIKEAAKLHLTGSKTVIFRERNTSPYNFHVVTRTSETPDSAVVLAAMMAEKPAGLVMTYAVVPGQDYQELLDNHATYQIVLTAYATYDALVRNQAT